MAADTSCVCVWGGGWVWGIIRGRILYVGEKSASIKLFFLVFCFFIPVYLYPLMYLDKKRNKDFFSLWSYTCPLCHCTFQLCVCVSGGRKGIHQ